VEKKKGIPQLKVFKVERIISSFKEYFLGAAFIFAALGFIFKFLWKRNTAFERIISDFNDKLPSKQNQAQILSENEKEKYFGEDLSGIQVRNLGTQNLTISEKEINEFYRKLESFDYRFVIFKKYYKSYSKNLLRLNPKATCKNLDIEIAKSIIDNEMGIHPYKLVEVIHYHLKYEFGFFSRIVRVFIGK
jgi:hypothetical protein